MLKKVKKTENWIITLQIAEYGLKKEYWPIKQKIWDWASPSSALTGLRCRQARITVPKKDCSWFYGAWVELKMLCKSRCLFLVSSWKFVHWFWGQGFHKVEKWVPQTRLNGYMVKWLMFKTFKRKLVRPAT